MALPFTEDFNTDYSPLVNSPKWAVHGATAHEPHSAGGLLRGSSAAGSNDQSILCEGETFANDQYAQITLALDNLNNANYRLGLILRGTTGANPAILVRFRSSISTRDFEAYYWNSTGSRIQIGSAYKSATSFIQGNRFRIEASGTVLTLKCDYGSGWVTEHTWTIPSEAPTTGTPGVYIVESSDNFGGDDFEAGNLSAGASGVTGDLAATESDLDNATFDGLVLVKGDLAATELAADTAAFTGAVQIVGDIAAVESQLDAAAFTGAVQIIGDLAAVEDGQDTASFSGSGQVSSTGDLAAVEDGQDTAAFTGNVVVSGDLAATETEPDVASFTGSVLVVGNLAATETGLDTASFTGITKETATGDLAAVESGLDTAAFVGNVTITGDLAAVETELDVASFVGSVSVSGNFALTEPGQDSAAFTGSVIVTGNLAAVESGLDVAAFLQTVVKTATPDERIFKWTAEDRTFKWPDSVENRTFKWTAEDRTFKWAA